MAEITGESGTRIEISPRHCAPASDKQHTWMALNYESSSLCLQPRGQRRKKNPSRPSQKTPSVPSVSSNCTPQREGNLHCPGPSPRGLDLVCRVGDWPQDRTRLIINKCFQILLWFPHHLHSPDASQQHRDRATPEWTACPHLHRTQRMLASWAEDVGIWSAKDLSWPHWWK